MKDTEIKKLIKIFFKDKIGAEITDNTILFDGLDIDGFDIWALMNDFAIEFNVKLDEYDYQKYHTSEADILNWPKSFLQFILGKRIQYKSFTINHLVDVVCLGKWFDPTLPDEKFGGRALQE